MNKKILTLIIGLVVLIIVAINYSFLDKATTKFLIHYEEGKVERVIDGDTVVINNESVRLLGINSPEKNEVLYQESKEFLENEILNKTVQIYFEKERYDLYNRTLGYIYFNETNINLESVENGFSNFYFPDGKNQYYPKFYNAWKNCLAKNINLCEKSQDVCANCIVLKDWDVENQLVILKNNCNFSCDLTNWSIKDEGRKKFVFPRLNLNFNEEFRITNDSFSKNYVWTKTGDSLFLRDSKNKLVIWDSF